MAAARLRRAGGRARRTCRTRTARTSRTCCVRSASRRVVGILRLNAIVGGRRTDALWSRFDARQVSVCAERPDFGEEMRRVSRGQRAGNPTGSAGAGVGLRDRRRLRDRDVPARAPASTGSGGRGDRAPHRAARDALPRARALQLPLRLLVAPTRARGSRSTTASLADGGADHESNSSRRARRATSARGGRASGLLRTPLTTTSTAHGARFRSSSRFVDVMLEDAFRLRAQRREQRVPLLHARRPRHGGRGRQPRRRLPVAARPARAPPSIRPPPPPTSTRSPWRERPLIDRSTSSASSPSRSARFRDRREEALRLRLPRLSRRAPPHEARRQARRPPPSRTTGSGTAGSARPAATPSTSSPSHRRRQVLRLHS